MDILPLIRIGDERRAIAVPGDQQQTIEACADYFCKLAKEAIANHGFFSVALSGGSTPKAIYQALLNRSEEVEWSKVKLFWSDERNVPPTHPDSNYSMAMNAAFSKLPIKKEQIFRMHAEENIEENARTYESVIAQQLGGRSFDLMLLGIGEDGHTASLFPLTHGLRANERIAIANFIPQLSCWRMTLTFEAINGSKHITIIALGRNKADIVSRILMGPYDPGQLPAQAVGTMSHRAVWILDNAAAGGLGKLE